jgi:thiamine biosynthesis lipoprotein ApbE
VAWRLPGGRTRTLKLRPDRPALSASAPHGRAFLDGARLQGRVLDPHTGQVAGTGLCACVVGPSSTVCEALSTAVLAAGEEFRRRIRRQLPAYEAWAA